MLTDKDECEPNRDASSSGTVSEPIAQQGLEKNAEPVPDAQVGDKKGWRFAMIIIALSVTGLLTSLENTITSTALPTIVEDLKGDNLYIWVVNAYTLPM